MTLEEIYGSTQFENYYRLLTEWNEKFNLTTLIQKSDVYLKHFWDSALAADLFPKGARVLDVGSGAGMPGICLKLVRDDLDIALLDSVGKKVTFLQAVIDGLKLQGICAVKSRIEEYKRRDFDAVTARAVASAGVIAEYCLPFVRLGGFALFYKSDDIDSELDGAKNAIKTLGGKVESVEKRQLTESIIRSLVIVRKVSETPPKYPRAGNKPRLDPL